MSQESKKQSIESTTTAPTGSIINTVIFTLKMPIPRTAPYAKFRCKIYVPADVKRWREKIARCALKCGLRKPGKGERVVASYHYGFKKSHADHDSITHSAQDALSKDALHVSDKEWFVGSITSVRVPNKYHEFIKITVEYRKEADGS